MSEEKVKIVNENDEIIKEEWKSICHKKGFWHRVSANLIFNSKGKIWIQKRAKGKIGEGLLDFSASGHVGLEESYEEAAYKELMEELGIQTDLKLKFEKLKENYDYPKKYKIRHIINLYIGYHDGPFNLQKEELENINAFSLDELKKILKNNPEKMTQGLKIGLKAYFNDLNKMQYKNLFPIFENNPSLIYLDSGATTQKPKIIIDKEKEFYENKNANIHRGLYKLSENATNEYENARKIIAKFINANQNEIIFTKGTTESINLLAYTIDSLISQSKLKGKNEIVLTELEHHSNLVPWQTLQKAFGYKLKFIPIKSDLTLDMNKAKEIINKNTAIVSITMISNALGTQNDLKEVLKLAKKHNALTIIDAAQAVAHKKIDVKELDCDFLAFSGHKAFAPLGIGILYGKYSLLDKLRPFHFGGDMIESVSFNNSTFQKPPYKFEAGTSNISGAICLGEAIKFIEKIGINNIKKYESELTSYAYTKLKTIKGITIYKPINSQNIISFNLNGIHCHDVAQILSDNYNICIRAGHHCAMPLMNKLKISGTCRISLSIYNSKEDIDKLIIGLNKVKEVFKK